MKGFLITVATVLAVSGCATKPEIPVVPGVLQGVRTTVTVDPRLLEDCEDYSNLVENPRPSDVLDQHAKDVKVINCWKTKHHGLVKTVKESFNLK